MAKPAVPDYVGRDFSSAAPGHRFNLYFPVWRDDWSLDKSHKAKALGETLSVQPVAGMLKSLRDRQRVLLAALPETDRFSLPAISTSPFATGLGNEHPVENGFAFLTPYGLPYLAGSGVKGVLRRAAEELALQGDDGDADLDTTAALPNKEGLDLLDVWWLFGFEGAAGAWWSLSRKEEGELAGERRTERADWKACFEAHLRRISHRADWAEFIDRAYPKGSEKAAFKSDPSRFIEALDRRRQDLHLRGALDFWDVFPEPKGGKLVVEIMTPHYSDYYQGKATPHDAGQPNPIPFLAVPAGSAFEFHVKCQPQRLPEHLRKTWQGILGTVCTHAFDWLGFGAKTAVGYGAMESDAMRNSREERAKARQERARAEAQQREMQRMQAAAVPWSGARLKFNRANKALSAEKDGKTAMALAPRGEQLLNLLPADLRKKVETNQFVRATAYVSGTELLRIEV